MTKPVDVAYEAGLAAGADLRESIINNLERENRVLRAASAILALCLGIVLWRR